MSGTDTDESDLDLLVDATETTTLFTLARLEHAARELLGVRVSVLTPGLLPLTQLLQFHIFVLSFEFRTLITLLLPHLQNAVRSPFYTII